MSGFPSTAALGLRVWVMRPSFEHKLVAGPERSGERTQLAGAGAAAALLRWPLAVQDRDLREAFVHVEAGGAHGFRLPFRLGMRRATHDTYGFALAAQPGQSQGQPKRVTDSRSIGSAACPSSVARFP